MMMPNTAVSIIEPDFLVNGRQTYEGRVYKGLRVEGLLFNSRMVQAIFDDLNPATRRLWDYPDRPWEPDRNTQEFVTAVPEWRSHGLLGFTINLKGEAHAGIARESCSPGSTQPSTTQAIVEPIIGPGSRAYSIGQMMDAPYLVEMTTDGKIVWEWRNWEHLDPVNDGITAVQDDRDVWTVANAVWELADGNLLVSFRAISTVVMIDRRTGGIYWKLGPPPLAGQHAPYILANGNLLLFDNGPHRLDATFPFSRVLEIGVATRRIVWKYQDNPVSNFFSPRISNAQRLPNGNTLINEGWFDRLFEVTPEGETVWEYVNPHFGPVANSEHAQVNWVFRAYRYTEAEIQRAEAAI
jgi:hypothetical protein